MSEGRAKVGRVMATEVELRIRFDRGVDIEELVAEVAAQQDCTVLDWDVVEDV